MIEGVGHVKQTDKLIFMLIKGFFFLILAICGNFFAPILNCNLQYLLTHNVYIKHILVIVIIYFTLTSFTETIISPIDHMFNAFIIWVFFIAFSKTGLYFSKAIMILIAALLICKDYISYYESFALIKYEDIISNLNNIFKYGTYMISITTIVGFIIYFKKQYRDHYKDFSIIIFLFGNNMCDSIT